MWNFSSGPRQVISVNYYELHGDFSDQALSFLIFFATMMEAVRGCRRRWRPGMAAGTGVSEELKAWGGNSTR